MSVHLYRVNSDVANAKFEALIANAGALDIEKRIREVSNSELRLESHASPKSGDNKSDYWLMDFTKLRFAHGPGKASRIEPIEGFDLGENEGFGEETSALYDPTTKHMLVQYNHHGPRAHAIRAYLAACDESNGAAFELLPHLDTTAETRLAKNKIIKKIEFKVAPIDTTKELRAANVGLGKALELRQDLGGETIEITISGGHGNLADGAVRGLIDTLRNVRDGMFGVPANAVKTLKIYTKPSADTPIDVIDLLTPKLELQLSGLSLGSDLRFTRESRWNALLRARKGWDSVVKT